MQYTNELDKSEIAHALCSESVEHGEIGEEDREAFIIGALWAMKALESKKDDML